MTEELADTLSTIADPAQAAALKPGPALVLLCECQDPFADSVRVALSRLDEVLIGRGSERRVLRDGKKKLHIRVADAWMSSYHARLTADARRWIIEDLGSKNGTLVNGQAKAKAALADGDVVELGHTIFIFRDPVPIPGDQPEVTFASRLSPRVPELATFVVPLEREFAALEQIARRPVSVVVFGESGTGKEIVARALHELSARKGNFVPVNCGALPANLVEAQLFGHRRGAFSGAVSNHPGLVRAAEGGTLFLDEIGDLRPASQAAFLRVLQEHEVIPVGGTLPIPVDIRVIAATHRDLDQLVAAGEFRQDLYARLRGFTLRLPPMRERREDLGMIVARLLRRINPSQVESISFAPGVVRKLLAYRWPENIRELEKCLEAALALAGRQPIGVEHLPEELRRTAVPGEGKARASSWPDDPVDRNNRAQLIQLLAEHDGNVSAVARALGKARMQIHRWVKRYDIDLAQFRRGS